MASANLVEQPWPAFHSAQVQAGHCPRSSASCLRSLCLFRRQTYLTQGVSFRSILSHREVLATDMFLVGWGAIWQYKTGSGQWSPWQQEQHINVLQLQGVLHALRHFLPVLVGKHVIIRTDNTSVVYHINHQRGTESKQSQRWFCSYHVTVFHHCLSYTQSHHSY